MLFVLLDSVEVTVDAEAVLKAIFVAVVLLLVVIGPVEAESVFPSTCVNIIVFFVLMDS